MFLNLKIGTHISGHEINKVLADDYWDRNEKLHSENVLGFSSLFVFLVKYCSVVVLPL